MNRLLVFLCLLPACAIALADAQRFDIPAQPLPEALKAFADQSKMQLLYKSHAVSAGTSNTVVGAFEKRAALELLLKGTGFEVVFSKGNAATVRPVQSALKTTAALAAEARDLQLTQSGQTSPAVAEGAPNGADEDEKESSISEIIVTAQKRLERLHDVPSSVSVLSARQMIDSHQTRLIDYAATIPGLQVESTAPGRSRLTLRGLALHGDGATVGTYIDDVPVGLSGPGQNARGSAVELLPYDLERIEVSRGPQGTFYGANALGGLLKYVTQTPDLHERSLAVGTDFLHIDGGSDTGYSARIAANGPLVDGKVGVRASYGHDYTPGYLDLPALSRQNVNKTIRQMGNLALLWQTTDRLSLRLAALVDEIDSADNALVRLDFPAQQPVLGDLHGGNALAQPFKRTEQLYSATLKYDLGGSELTSVSSFADSRTETVVDVTISYGPVVTLLTEGAFGEPLVPLDVNIGFKKYTQELRLATPSDARLAGMLGVFLTHEEAAKSRQVLEALDAEGTPITGFSPLVTVDSPTTYQEQAVFTNLTYKLTPQFDVSAGVRLARNQQKLRSSVSGPLFPSDDSRAHSSESVFNYSIAPRWRLNEEVMIYLRAATGYRPGGPNIVLNPASDVPRQFKSDRIVNYEAGVKSALLAGRMELNASIYQIDWQDVQLGLVDFSTATGYFDNGKEARSRGLELEGLFRPMKGLDLGLAATWIDAILTEDLPDNSSLVGRSGDRLPAAPRFMGSATVNYRFPLLEKWTAALGSTYRYAGSHYSALSGDPNTLQLAAYSTVDLNAGATSNTWSVNFFVRNLTDKRAYVQKDLFTDVFTNAPVGIDAAVLQPRTLGVSLDKRF